MHMVIAHVDASSLCHLVCRLTNGDFDMNILLSGQIKHILLTCINHLSGHSVGDDVNLDKYLIDKHGYVVSCYGRKGECVVELDTLKLSEFATSLVELLNDVGVNEVSNHVTRDMEVRYGGLFEILYTRRDLPHRCDRHT